MKIAILHYHLNPGGVTRIIEMQLAALLAQKEITEIQVFSGAKESSITIPSGVEFIYNPVLNYLDCSKLNGNGIDMKYNRMIDFFLDETSPDTIIHAHNMNLGKNPILTAVLNNLVDERKIVNHIHDFAEDRPANISELKKLIEKKFRKSLLGTMYPDHKNCHYAVLNSSYVERLAQLSIPTERVSLLPNPVSIANISVQDEITKAKEKAQKLLKVNPELLNYVYPVRGIRRKNLGEFILLASLFKDKANWITTLPPLNPVEKIEYDKWKDFCIQEQIQLFFEAGEICAFGEVMALADRCVTTSTREGFGMVFLESWLFEMPIVGRDLPVSKDFRDAGIKFDGLYQNLNHDGIDFAELDQKQQMKLIKEFSDNPDLSNSFIAKNPSLKNIFKDFSLEFINANREIIKQQYSVENYGKKLLNIYKTFV